MHLCVLFFHNNANDASSVDTVLVFHDLRVTNLTLTFSHKADHGSRPADRRHGGSRVPRVGPRCRRHGLLLRQVRTPTRVTCCSGAKFIKHLRETTKPESIANVKDYGRLKTQFCIKST